MTLAQTKSSVENFQRTCDLVCNYEKLRFDVLALRGRMSLPSSYGLFIRSGMAKWMETCHSVLTESCLAKKDNARQGAVVELNSRSEIIHIITGMVFENVRRQNEQ